MAARGPGGRKYPWGNDFDRRKLLCSKSGLRDTERHVSSRELSFPGVSPYGAMDMAGSVWEWCLDWYDGSYCKFGAAINPINLKTGTSRILRGGSWGNSNPELFRTSYRNGNNPALRYIINGFRCLSKATRISDRQRFLRNRPPRPASPPRHAVVAPVPIPRPASAQPAPAPQWVRVASAPASPPTSGSHVSGASAVNPLDGAVLVYVPTGTYTLGDTDQSDNPPHKVILTGYHIYKHPVTVAQYRRFCCAVGRSMPYDQFWSWKDEHPIVNVNWDDAQAYCNWADVRLPTESEWEMAARGTDGGKYPWGNDFDYRKLCCSKSQIWDAKGTSPVGSFPSGASPFGALDMAGNVWEWCQDLYDKEFWKLPPVVNNPANLKNGRMRVVRGGSWANTDPLFFRAARRNYLTPSSRLVNYGFRCASGP